MKRYVLSLSLVALLLLSLSGARLQAQSAEAQTALPQLTTFDGHLETSELKPAVELMNDRNWGEAVRALNDFIEQHSDHLEARYYRAVARRERAKLRTLRAKVTDQWEKGIADFEYIIQRDSSYRDVLYQYALFSQVQKRLTDLRNIDQNIDYRDAIRLGHAQLRHRPDVPAHRYHLFVFYRRYIHHTNPDAALTWLRSQSSDYAAYFSAEVLRLDNQLQEADHLLSDLADSIDRLPLQVVLLSRARIHYALNEPARAEQFVRQAIEEISSPIAAAFVLEDFKYILNEREFATYRSLQSSEEYRQYFRQLWTQRNPMPARDVNVRLARHYKRLLTAERDYWFDGLRLWHNNPDETRALEFPVVYTLNREFNDKGLVFIRHGEPDDRVVTVEGEINTFRSGQGVLPKNQSFRASWVPNESWRYTYASMDFHFVVGEGATGNNWRLVPTVTNFHMLEDREMWGGVYRQMARAARDVLSQQGSSIDASNQSLDDRGSSSSFSAITDFNDARNSMLDKSRETVAAGLTSDRHTWRSEIRSIDIPHILAAFQGPNGKMILQIYYSLPIQEIAGELDDAANAVRIEAGYALHNSNWEPVAQEVTVHSVSPEIGSRPINPFETTVPPDSYQVAIHGRSLDSDLMGGYKFGYRIPDLSGNNLTASDLLLARSITPAEDSSAETRDGLEIIVDPEQQFAVDAPLHIYFEIYRLTLGDSDRTDYTLTYSLVPEQRDRGFFGRIFGSDDEEALSLENTQTGRTTSPTEYAEIDISEIDPGTYTFTVTVTDNHSDTSVQRSREVEIVQ